MKLRFIITILLLSFIIVGCSNAGKTVTIMPATETITPDPSTLEEISIYYHKDSDNVYYSQSHLTKKIIKGADPESFEVMDKFHYSYIAKDKNYAYFHDEMILEIDSSTFEIISNYFYKDKNYVYHRTGKTDLDVSTFEQIEVNYYKDKDAVYIGSSQGFTEIPNSDSETFELLGNFHSKDKNQFYYHKGVVEGVDMETLESIDDVFYKDKNNVYYARGKVNGADPETIEILFRGKRYSKDKNHVYFENDIIEGADTKTFQSAWGYGDEANWYYFEDKNYYYQEGKRIKERTTHWIPN